MTMVKSLVALATERMLLKTSGQNFLRGIEFMYSAGLAPERLSVMMTTSRKYILQFHSKCDVRPFAANYPNFSRVLRGIVHVRAWNIKSIEFVNVAFFMADVENLERTIEKLGVELVLLRNCSYPGVSRGEEAVRFLSALNRRKQAVVCEYGDDRLKHRISRSNLRGRRERVNVQEEARLDGAAPADANVAAQMPAIPVVGENPGRPRALIDDGLLPAEMMELENEMREEIDVEVEGLNGGYEPPVAAQRPAQAAPREGRNLPLEIRDVLINIARLCPEAVQDERIRAMLDPLLAAPVAPPAPVALPAEREPVEPWMLHPGVQPNRLAQEAAMLEEHSRHLRELYQILQAEGRERQNIQRPLPNQGRQDYGPFQGPVVGNYGPFVPYLHPLPPPQLPAPVVDVGQLGVVRWHRPIPLRHRRNEEMAEDEGVQRNR